MKVLISILLVLMVFNTRAQPVVNKDIVAINQVLNTQADAWNTGSIDGYMQGYWNSDSLLFIGSKGPAYGYATTLERYKKSYPDKAAMGTLSFSNLSFYKLSNEYYHVVGAWKLVREKDTPGGYFTLLFKKIKGKWLIVADHTS